MVIEVKDTIYILREGTYGRMIAWEGGDVVTLKEYIKNRWPAREEM